MRDDLQSVVQQMEALGFVEELRVSDDSPHRLVWPDEPLLTVPLVADREGKVSTDFVVEDVAVIDSELANRLREKLEG